jgi:cob(I)alamin adenosyltransferase
MSDEGTNERHRARMQRKKEVVDKKIEAAKRDAGVLLVNTGTAREKAPVHSAWRYARSVTA